MVGQIISHYKILEKLGEGGMVGKGIWFRAIVKAYFYRTSLCLLLCALAIPIPMAVARTIEFETSEVTEADVTLSPDGQWLIFTLLGHLFRLPVAGGQAEQLTFGPYYDTDPVFSPDGKRVAFGSDRDGSEGNVFVLELATGEITQVTHEPWAGRPTWAPDGQAIVYLRFVSEAPRFPFDIYGPPVVPALVRQVALSRGEPETLSAPPRLFRSVFHPPDGRLAWTVIERETGSSRRITRIEAMSPQGTVSTLRTLDGEVHRVVASPTGDGLYCRRIPLPYDLDVEELFFLPLPEGAETLLAVLPPHQSPQFAVAADNKTLYLGEGGQLWKIALPSGARKLIAFSARVKLEIQDPMPPPKWALTPVGSSVPPRSVVNPRLSPDGQSLVFMAAGYLWQQPLDGGGEPQRLFEGKAIEWDPVLSPDEQQLAFVHRQYGKEEVRVFDFETRQTRTLASGLRYRQASWSRDGQRLIFAEYDGGTYHVVAVNLSEGKKEKLVEAGRWSPRPHFSADGESLYFTAKISGIGTLYRLPLQEKAKPEPITQLARHLSDGLVSPDGKWLAFRRNMEIWVAPLGPVPVKDRDVQRLNPEGGKTFAFTPDSSAVIYSAGNRVWRHPLAGGEREEIPIGLELPRATPPSLLVRRVRVLDFASGGFSPETSLFIEQGRIRWIGSERGRELRQEAVIVDAGGRFAIPGLFDLHVHPWGAEQEAFVAYGVTSVRDVGGWLTWVNALADRSEATSDPVPRYFFSGEFFQGTQPGSDSLSLLIYNEEEARSYVRWSNERGLQFLKVYNTLSWPLQRAVAEEARRLGLPVVGHGTNVEEVAKSVTLGYAFLEHTNFPNRFYDDVLQLLAAATTRWDPTLAVGGGNGLLLHDEPERLAEAKFRAFAPERFVREGNVCWAHKAARGGWVEQLASIRAAHRRGVQLQVGTDATQACVFYGSSLHWELEYFVQAELTPLEVLRIATQEAAAAVGAEDDLGTLEPGKLADLVLLDKNPLEDIRNSQTIWRVIKGGWVFDPEKLRPPASAGPER